MTVTDDLVKRLRRTYRKEFAPTGSMVATPRTVQSRLLSVDVLFNPDGAEAADRIEALTAENERLREALVKVAAECRVPVGNDTVMYVRWRALAVERVDIARAALEGKQ